MIDDIKTVAVLGASGTIGSLTGGIIAQQGIKVYFLSRTTQGSQRGLEKAISQARSEVIGCDIVCGSYDQLARKALSKADWIVECVTENLAATQQIYEIDEQYKRSEAIVSSTTSSLPLDQLAKGRSENFKKNFLSTHVYNPPGKMPACEITSTADTDPQVTDFMADFLENKLRRVVIPVKNTAGFAGNRVAFVLFNKITKLVEEYGAEKTDYLIGPYTGRAMAPLATIDLVGLNIHKAIIQSLQKNTNDQMHQSLVIPDYINKMIDKGLLGNKAGGGFYKKFENGKLAFIDPTNCDYTPSINPQIEFVEKAKSLIHIGKYQQAFEIIKNAQNKEADIVRDILCTYVAYSYSRIGEVTENKYGIEGIDKVMCFGFNWAPPSLILKMLGGNDAFIEMLEKKQMDIPKALSQPDDTPAQVHNWGKYFVAR